MSLRPMFLIIEGPNYAGKSTLERRVLHATQHTFPVKVRFAGSCFVYDHILARMPTQDPKDMLLRLKCGFDVYQVVLLPDMTTLMERSAQRASREGDPASHPNLADQCDGFARWAQFSSRIVPTVVFWEPEVSAEQVLSWLTQVQYRVPFW